MFTDFKVFELEKYVRVRTVGSAPLTRIPHIKYIFITLTHTETCTIIHQYYTNIAFRWGQSIYISTSHDIFWANQRLLKKVANFP